MNKKIELKCKKLKCPNYIEWSFGYGSICYSCKLAGESDHIYRAPDNCPNKDKIMLESKGLKYDDDKLRWDLLPLEDIEEIVKVYTAGAKKYAPNNWQNVPDGYNRYKAAMFRHLVEFEKGNAVDEETGCLHLAQVAWNAIAMLHYYKESLKEKI